MKGFLFRLAILILLTLFHPLSYAAAFQLYELGTPIIGTAGVGQAVVTNDASSSYFNPAAMAALPTTEFMIGSQLILPRSNFSRSTATTISGDNGGNAGTLTPGMGLYYVYNLASCLKFGLSFTSPYGGWLTYNDGWVGRFFVQETQFYTLNLNPSLAYQINNWAAIGAGFVVEYANLHQTIALPLTPLVDGQATIKVHNYASGFNLGILLLPTQRTKLGLAYRSKISHNLHGTTTFLRISATPNTSTKMIMPHNIILSVSQNIANYFNLLAELGWSNWSTMKNTIIHIEGFSAVTPRKWHNTYRAGVAAQIDCSPLLLQAGASYDSSPTSSSHRLPDLPMDRQIRAGAGLLYTLYNRAQIGLSYEYINFGRANINNISSNGHLVGSYSRNYASLVQASINIPC